MAMNYFDIAKRRRGTAIVETARGIVLTSGRSRIFLLPGGGANEHESRSKAAVREMYEETGLKAYSSQYLFEHMGHIHRKINGRRWQDYHKVFLIKATGVAKPHHEIRHIGFYTQGCHLKVSSTTKEIINKYYAYKNPLGLHG
jgi:8-oxo-dGTP diphosphatase